MEFRYIFALVILFLTHPLCKDFRFPERATAIGHCTIVGVARTEVKANRGGMHVGNFQGVQNLAGKQRQMQTWRTES